MCWLLERIREFDGWLNLGQLFSRLSREPRSVNTQESPPHGGVCRVDQGDQALSWDLQVSPVPRALSPFVELSSEPVPTPGL